jgi:hypothetical protein
MTQICQNIGVPSCFMRINWIKFSFKQTTSRRIGQKNGTSYELNNEWRVRSERGGRHNMQNLGGIFLTAGVVLELVGIYLVYRGKSSSLEPIILGLLCFLVGFLAS